jgi:hypothetical protein
VSGYPILAGFAHKEIETGKTEDESDTGLPAVAKAKVGYAIRDT